MLLYDSQHLPIDPMLAPWCERWRLMPDGGAFSTPYTRSVLLPVVQDGRAAILKVAGGRAEARGAGLMAWWAGEGAAPVLAHEGPALLLARAADPEALPRLAFEGEDDAATEILCAAIAELHRSRGRAPPADLVPLAPWFRALQRAASQGDLFARAWSVAEPLLARPQDEVVLHGDITHANVLDFGDAGWLAIDPKGLLGERGYDYANLFRSPTLSVVTPERFRRQLDLTSRLAGLERDRLLRWVISHGALSAAWTAALGVNPQRSLDFVELAFAELAIAGRKN
jgi:streptomycin 6-kinase